VKHSEPKDGERWTHPDFGAGTIRITPGGHIEFRCDNGICAAYRAARHFLEEKPTRESEASA